jgi:arsenate reductase
MTIYHNPRCKKSRETLELIREQGIEPEIVEYLKTPPEPEELRSILDKLGLEAEAIVRKGEKEFKERFKGKALSDEEWLRGLNENPKLIERPIVVEGERAAIGRPPENVKELF